MQLCTYVALSSFLQWSGMRETHFIRSFTFIQVQHFLVHSAHTHWRLATVEQFDRHRRQSNRIIITYVCSVVCRLAHFSNSATHWYSRCQFDTGYSYYSSQTQSNDSTILLSFTVILAFSLVAVQKMKACRAPSMPFLSTMMSLATISLMFLVPTLQAFVMYPQQSQHQRPTMALHAIEKIKVCESKDCKRKGGGKKLKQLIGEVCSVCF
jgi:hypothetical protein